MKRESLWVKQQAGCSSLTETPPSSFLLPPPSSLHPLLRSSAVGWSNNSFSESNNNNINNKKYGPNNTGVCVKKKWPCDHKFSVQVLSVSIFFFFLECHTLMIPFCCFGFVCLTFIFIFGGFGFGFACCPENIHTQLHKLDARDIQTHTHTHAAMHKHV